MDYWLKALGMGARAQPIPDDWASLHDGIFRRAVTFPHRPGVRVGDRIVLYASRIGVCFAAGVVTTDPDEDARMGDSEWPWFTGVSLDHWVDSLREGVLLTNLNVEGRDLRKSIRRRSHIRLSEAEHNVAIEALPPR